MVGGPDAALSLDEIDLSDIDGFWSLPRPARDAAFATLRRERPLSFFPEPPSFAEPGPGFWAVTRHAAVVEASHRPDDFCSGRGAISIPDIPVEFLEYYGSMINLDDPRHARLRRIVSRAFTPKRLATASRTVTEVARQIVDRVSGMGSCDFVTDVAAALPLRIICQMMGIPDSQYAFVLERTNVVLGANDPEFVPEGTDVFTALLNAGIELGALMKELGAARQAHPTEDVTSALVNAEVDGERLTFDELASFFILLVVAGNETTRNAISWGLVALSDHPDQKAIWQSDLARTTPSAVDEIVRWASPVIQMRRTATRPATLAGHRFEEGEKLVLFYNSANRDEAVFADPYHFDVRRTENRHLGFGGSGPHFCLGAHLARRELAVMFEELLTRLPDIEVTGEPQYLRSLFINGIKHLPCSFRAVGT